jgi:hypothetical protein
MNLFIVFKAEMHQMFIYWGKSTFSASFISFKKVCKMQDLAGGGITLLATIFTWTTAF